MRNLKRVLSLALASIMLLGMMVIGASAADKKTAADLTDIDKVTNKEAVNLMVDLGIVEGKPDGSYDPTATVDRATMAKLITLILMGDVDSDTFAGTTTDLKDVPDNNWAKGFINYCYSNNIISGDGKGNFFPATKVKVVEAAKMLLVALGYDAEDRGYVGDNWSVNIMKDAKTKGLLDGFDANKAQNELTRDNAAQMIYNTLMAYTVTAKYDRDMGEKYVSEYENDKTTLGYQTYGLIKVTATVSGVTSGKATLTGLNYALANSYVNNKLPATSDIVGKKVAVFVKGTLNTSATPVTVASVEKLISSALATSENVVLATVEGTGISNLANALNSSHKDFIAEVEDAPAAAANAAPTVTYYVNGNDNSSGNRYGNGTTDAAAGGYNSTPAVNTTVDVSSIVAKKGVIVEFVDTDSNGKANIVKITDKAVYKLTADADTKVVNNKTQVKVPGIGALNAFSSSNTTENVFGFEDLKKDDIVLYYAANGNHYVEKAESINGQLTAVKNGSDLIISGSTYKVSGLTNAITVAGVIAEGYNVDVTYWLDNGGNIIKAAATEEVASEYAIVTGWRNAGSFGDVEIEAKLLMADGTIDTVIVSKFANTETGALGDCVITGSGAHDVTAGLGAQNAPITVPVAYSIDKDGNYRLNKIDATSTSSSAYSVLTLTNAKVENNKAIAVPNATNSGSSEDIKANAKTAFLVKDGSKVEVYEGIANAPKYTNGATGATGVALVNKSGIAVMVYITAGTNEGVSSKVDRAYIIDNTSKTYYPAVTGSHDAYYEYAAIIDGAVSTIKVMEGSAAEKAITANTIYALTLNKDGLVTSVTRSTGWDTGVKYLDGVVRVGASNYYTYDDDSVIYVIDGDTATTVAPADIAEDANASVLFVQKSVTDATIIKELYIVKNNVALPTALTVTNSGLTVTGSDLLSDNVTATGAAVGDTLTVTATPAAGTSVVVKINGTGATSAATHTIAAGDVGTSLQISVVITETATGATQTLKYQIPLAA